MLPRLIGLVLLGLVIVTSAWAAVPAPVPPTSTPPSEKPPENVDPLGRDTPRGTVIGFMKAASDLDYQKAARYLDTRGVARPIADRVTELHAVLNRVLETRILDQLSKEPDGNRDDDLPPNLERIGEFTIGTTALDVLLERSERKGEPPIWRFSATTLKQIPDVYQQIRPTWIETYVDEHLWAPLTQTHFMGVPLWKWLVLPLTLIVVWLLARLVSRGLVAALRPLMFRLSVERAADAAALIVVPVRVVALGSVILAWAGISRLPLLNRFLLERAGAVVAIVGLGWLVIRLIDITAEAVKARLRRLNHPGSVSVADLIARLSKALIAVVAVLILLHYSGFELTTALAGLGIGGIAIAFAAQKTLENLFGGITIISDQPVRVGDFCKAGDVVGIVESIGLRSTQIRTLDRTVVSVPNAQMSTVNIENYGFRDKVWFRPTLNLRYETQADQLRYVLAQIRRLLYEHPMVENESARIRFVRFGGSSLDLEIFAYVLTGDFARYLEVQEDLLLRIMDIVAASGTTFAFPSSTTYIARDTGLDGEKTQEAIARVGRWREERELPFPNFHPSRIAEFENRIEYPAADSAVARPAAASG
jgi:MscS family membrane protein